MLSHANLYGCALASLAEGVIDADDVVLHVAPMFQLADLFYMLMASMRLLPQVVCPRLEPELVFAAIETPSVDRKSVVEGKSVSVRVDPGGSRSIKKKKKMTILRHED